MAWFYLLLAALTETTFGIGMFHSRGFTQLWPSVYGIGSGVATMGLLALAMKGLPIGVAIMVWSGLAMVGTALYGILALGEPRDLRSLGFMALIVAGVMGLKLSSSH